MAKEPMKTKDIAWGLIKICREHIWQQWEREILMEAVHRFSSIMYDEMVEAAKIRDRIAAEAKAASVANAELARKAVQRARA